MLKLTYMPLILLVISIASSSFAIEYSMFDCYIPGDYVTESINVNTSEDIYNARGSHQLLLSNKRKKVNDKYDGLKNTANAIKNSAVLVCLDTYNKSDKSSDASTASIACMNSAKLTYDLLCDSYEKNRTIELNNIKSYFINEMAYLNNRYSRIVNVNDLSGNLIVSAYILKSNSQVDLSDNAYWNKIVVMADGYDPGNLRTIHQLCAAQGFSSLFQTVPFQSGIQTPLSSGYNVCVVDFSDGAGDIKKNAKAMLKIIQYVSSKSHENKVVVGGFSMGGQISRLALLYAQSTDTDISNVAKYIAIDSPQKGSAIPISLQSFVKNFGGDKFAELNQDAAKQMCFEHIESQYDSYTNKACIEHDKFYNYLNSLSPFNSGFPTNIKLYSLAASNWQKQYPSANPPTLAYTVTILTQGPQYINIGADELEPGSSVDLFGGVPTYQNVWDVAPKGVSLLLLPLAWIPVAWGTVTQPQNSTDSRYKPTFMPIRSVFALKDNAPVNLQNENSLATLVAEKWTPFHKIALTSNRLEHIEFTEELIGKLVAFLDDDDKIPENSNMVKIPSNSNLNIKEFYIARTETTRREYYNVMKKRPTKWINSNYNLPASRMINYYDAILYCNALSIKEGLQPVYSYTGTPTYWDSENLLGCIELKNLVCNDSKNGYRLPTLTEWQYAYLAGANPADNNGYYWPPTADTKNYAWWWNVYFEWTMDGYPVGGLLPNNFGLYDMAGNVSEWVWNNPQDINANVYSYGGYFGGDNVSYTTNSSKTVRSLNTYGIGFRVVRKKHVDITPVLNLLLND